MATITKRGKSYYFRASDGYSVNGKQHRPTMTWTPPEGMKPDKAEKEAQIQAALFEDRVRQGQRADGTIKFEAFAERFMADHAVLHLAPKTVQDYQDLLPRINQALGHLRMDRIRPNHLADFYKNLGEKGVKGNQRFTPIAAAKPSEGAPMTRLGELAGAAGLNIMHLAKKADVSHRTASEALRGSNVSEKSAKALSKALGVKQSSIFTPVDPDARLTGSTVQHYHRLLSSIFSKAVIWQIITSNPAERVDPPKSDTEEAAFLNDEEARDLVQLLASVPEQLRTIIILLIYTGLRRGELCGLRWSDIDFTKRVLHVRRKIQRLRGQGLVESLPKKKSVRPIKLSGAAIQLLLSWRNSQRAEIEAMGDQWQDKDLIFTNWKGSYLDPHVVSRQFSDFIKRSGLTVIKLHGLRHTNATLMIAGGTDIPTVSRRLGHAQIGTTTNIYAHAIRSADEAAARTLENIMDPIKPGDKVVRISNQNRKLSGTLDNARIK